MPKNEEFADVSREELYERVWATPINHLAKSFGVSGSYLARVCETLNIPRPPVGYWQKKAVGKAPPRPSLAPAQPGDQVVWSKSQPLAIDKRSRNEKRPKPSANARLGADWQHPLLRGTEPLFRKTRRLEAEEFLNPTKKLLPDIICSAKCLERALSIANELYRAMERKGHRIQIAPPNPDFRRAHIEDREVPGKDRKYGRYGFTGIWSPLRPTITFFDDVPIGLALTEMTERAALRYLKGEYYREASDQIRRAKPWQLANSWTREQDIPSGRLRFVAYSPYRGVDWSLSWDESNKRRLEGMILGIIKKLADSASRISTLMKEADEAAIRRRLEWEEKHQRYLREQDQRRVAQARTESLTQLAEVIRRWDEVSSIERFFAEAEARVQSENGDRTVAILERLDLAWSLIGTSDPLEFLEEWVAPKERYRSEYGLD
ncbi:hypothetical protein EOI86_22755 [Hwanghaeella grinnelliae]|uniref:Uncharacterized protein n=1 Tax=Hwanghaeella grinnelliae TaxID=2500179 RepID=A0A437QI03_9PROT|nr:hypothetical protein [Hwanghaeella grinnelliae]RVU33950.1 hypothetical protein EOI86_22755 [Hwanghaeella grinnelliae]